MLRLKILKSKSLTYKQLRCDNKLDHPLIHRSVLNGRDAAFDQPVYLRRVFIHAVSNLVRSALPSFKYAGVVSELYMTLLGSPLFAALDSRPN